MYCGRDFDPADSSENEIYTLDFVNDLAAGEQLSSATWTCAVAPDSRVQDASAPSRLSGGASVSGTQTTQRVTGLVAGAKYILRAVATTDQSNERVLYSHVLCQAAK